MATHKRVVVFCIAFNFSNLLLLLSTFSVILGDIQNNDNVEPVVIDHLGVDEDLLEDHDSQYPSSTVLENELTGDIVDDDTTKDVCHASDIISEVGLNDSEIIPSNNVTKEMEDDDNDEGVCFATNHTEENKPRFQCTKVELAENETAAVKIVNNTELFQTLNRLNTSEGPCAIVLFYAPWCRFSAAVAPHVNAVGRAYPMLHVLAVDAIQFSGLNARFGTVAVPNLILFHNGKPVARYNQTERTFEQFKSFIKNHTGIDADATVEVTDEDYLGPLPSVPTVEPDYFLWFSTLFVIAFICYLFKQKFGDRIMERVRTWAEIHEHLD
ncbi:thioredoxin domain-containing protein 15-like [Saccoglossus kowalevskii]|uniref:Thioredoxin domain-containing protein 15-like n=1 Tax=Saccoglossus kowalevskii TaxID=10224 RepID=A0ABM0GRZ5_SACKO|nr:PREDICTED: thioredoxin domain-containing protein 15-like [Saccoglossus kowalevskii]